MLLSEQGRSLIPSQGGQRHSHQTALDWQMKADLGKQLTIPEHIVETTVRPDIVLRFNKTGGLNAWALKREVTYNSLDLEKMCV